MDLKVIIKSKAKNDLKIALDWYRLQGDDLAIKLLNNIDDSINKILLNPFHCQVRYKEIRIAFTKRYPYGIYFSVETEKIIIHAILHNKQNPEIAIKRAD